MGKVVSVVSLKGGTGKSTLAANVAAVLAARVPVTLVDTDPQGSLTAWMGDQLPVVRTFDTGKLRAMLAGDWGGVAVVDARPGDLPLARMLVEVSALVLVPVRPGALDLQGAAPVLEEIQRAGVAALAVVTQADARTGDADTLREALARWGVPVARAVLHSRVAHPRAVVARCGVCEYAPSSRAAAEVAALAREIRKRLEV